MAAKHVLKYLCGTVDYGLDYQRGDGVRLVGQDVSVIERVLQGVVSDWTQLLCLGSVGSKSQWH